MKRSRLVNLMLLGIALTACDQKAAPTGEQKMNTASPQVGGQINGQVFKDESECQKIHGADACHKAFEDSKKAHAQTAPKFNSKEECEKLHGAGKCTESPHSSGSGSVFMPMMMGYMLGNMLGGRTQAAPVMAGAAGAAAAGSPWASRQAAPVQRNGFGGASRSFSSVGG